MNDKTKADTQRRSFLQTTKNVGLLGAALALLSRAAPLQAAEPQPAATDDEPKASGYHETDHIRKYYAKARQF
jgi:uncharacterized membrane protein